jgi:hypothetical protein
VSREEVADHGHGARQGVGRYPTGRGSDRPPGIVEIVVEFDEGEEVLAPKINERFGSYDLNEGARYIYFLSNHILKGGSG